MISAQSRSMKGLLASTSIISGVIFGTSAMAQTAQPTAVESVVVTGSRIIRDGYQAPTPTTVVGAADIQKSAPANIADFVNQLPALSGSTTARSPGGGATAGANFLNLRALGANRTLVLLDGRRAPPSSISGTVDVTLLPSSLVSRVDVVTGGASAAYGSDAVAGVVNFVLDREYTGFKGEVQGGITDEGDGGSYKVNLTAGVPFAGGRGHILGSIDRIDARGVGPTSNRKWFRGYNVIANPTFVAGNGQPARIIAPNVGLSQASAGGVITAGPLRGTQFLAGGQTAPFNFGFVSGLNSINGDAQVVPPAQTQVPVEATSLFFRGSYEITDAVTVFAEANYAKADSAYDVRWYERDGNITVRNDNAFLDATTRARMAAAGVTTFAMGKLHQDFPGARVNLERELQRFVVGAEGRFGGNWLWDADFQQARTDFLSNAVSQNLSNYNLAIDAVRDASGNAVCRSTLTSPSNGCVPLNLFGPNAASDAAKAYILGAARQLVKVQQTVASANLRGEPFALPAGPVSVAAGLEYRKEDYTADADANSLINNWFLGNYKPSAGQFDVREGYVEVVAPLFKDLRFVKALDFSGAIRRTDYSTSGQVTTWKGGFSWNVNDQVRFRSTRSRDIRAPNLNDLFLASSSFNFSLRDPVVGQTYTVQRITQGNLALVPERADTTALGVVLTPTWLDGFSVSTDYFNIDIEKAIVTPDGQTVIDQCVTGNAILCSAITRGANGLVTQLRVIPQNVQSETIQGLDVEATWRGDVGPGRMTLRTFATNTWVKKVRSVGATLSYAGAVGDGGGVPRFRVVSSGTYEQGGLAATLTGRFISESLLKREWGPADIAENSVDSRLYFDLSASYKFTVGGVALQAFGVVDNVFDRSPPVAPTVGGNAFISSGTNASLYDTIGRQVRGGLRFSF